MQVESIKFVFPIQGATNLRQLNVMREQGILTDVTIAVESRLFECHRAVLASSCEYFKAMFANGLREVTQKEIKLHGIQSDIMDNILQYAYTGMCVLTQDNAAELLSAADLFGFLPLRDAAAKYLLRCIDVTSCLQIRRLADHHSCQNLFKSADEFAKRHFSDIIQQEEFLDLGLNALIEYFEDDDLNVKRESLVFDAALRWIRHNVDERGKHVEKVLESVRLPFVKAEYLKLQATVDPLIYHNKACIRQVLEARTYQISGEFRNNFHGKQRKPRKCTSKEVLMVFGGESRIGSLHERVNDVACYDWSTQKWEELDNLPSDIHAKAFSVASLGYEVYLTGGTVDNKPSNEVLVFYTYLNKWAKGENLVTARYHHTCAVLEGSIYAVGGTDGRQCLTDVERYDSTKNKWNPIKHLCFAVKCPAVAGFKNKLFVFGGFSDQYIISPTIQIYTTTESQWSQVQSPLIDHSCAQAATISNKIYLLGGGSKTVKMFDQKTNAVSKVADMIQKRDNCGVTVVNNKLFVTGGVSESTASSLDTVEWFCPIRNKWEKCENMPRRLYRHGSVCIRIPSNQREKPKQNIKQSQAPD